MSLNPVGSRPQACISSTNSEEPGDPSPTRVSGKDWKADGRECRAGQGVQRASTAIFEECDLDSSAKEVALIYIFKVLWQAGEDQRAKSGSRWVLISPSPLSGPA